MEDNEEKYVEVELSKIVIREKSPEQYIYLKEIDGKRSFPIVIGIFEAIAINRHIKGEMPERPMTHDLLSSILEELDTRLDRVLVTDLKSDTFHANLLLRTDGKVVRVDSRPSDAIALAVRQDARIFVSETVLDRVNSGEKLGGP